MEARRAHNPEVVGSSPASATRKEKVIPIGMAFFFYPACVASPGRPPGYEDDERSSLGKRGDCRRWREKGAERSAAVCVQRSRTIGKAHTGHRKPGGRTDAEKLSGQAHIESCLRNQQCEPI